MKKQYLLFVPLLALLLILTACMSTPKETETVPPVESTETTEAVTEEETTVPETEIPYNEVERQPSNTLQTGAFGFKDDTFLINLSYPSEWTLSKAGENYEILRDDFLIGHLDEEDTPDSDEWKTLAFDETDTGSVSVTMYIERFGTGADADYRYRYDYVCWFEDEMRTLTLAVALSEVDKACEDALFTSASAVEKTSSETLGILSEYLGDSSSILILGNSFIGTSNIGNVLKEMLHVNGKSCKVTAISRGYARVATYIGDAALMDSLRGGAYDAVFICGFYGAEEVKNLGVLKEACDKSHTELIIFPAHNENATHVATAQNTYPSLKCLHWKNEINGLIEKGVDQWDMCINDSHKHSTPLAGYVGAHMIYRAIYGELPKAPMRSSISQTYIDKILGDYAYVGDAQIIPEEQILYLD